MTTRVPIAIINPREPDKDFIRGKAQHLLDDDIHSELYNYVEDIDTNWDRLPSVDESLYSARPRNSLVQACLDTIIVRNRSEVLRNHPTLRHFPRDLTDALMAHAKQHALPASESVVFVSEYCDCVELHMPTDSDLHYLLSLAPPLEILKLDSCDAVSDSVLRGFVSCAANLRVLHVTGSGDVADSGALAEIARAAPQLQELVWHRRVQSDVLNMLAANCPQLTSLSISLLDVVDCLPQPKLTTLEIRFGSIAPDVSVVSQAIKEVRLFDMTINVAALIALLPACERLSLIHTQVVFPVDGMSLDNNVSSVERALTDIMNTGRTTESLDSSLKFPKLVSPSSSPRSFTRAPCLTDVTLEGVPEAVLVLRSLVVPTLLKRLTLRHVRLEGDGSSLASLLRQRGYNCPTEDMTVGPFPCLESLRADDSNVLILLGDDSTQESLVELRLICRNKTIVHNGVFWPFAALSSQPQTAFRTLMLTQTPNLKVLHVSGPFDYSSIEAAFSLEHLETLVLSNVNDSLVNNTAPIVASPNVLPTKIVSSETLRTFVFDVRPVYTDLSCVQHLRNVHTLALLPLQDTTAIDWSFPNLRRLYVTLQGEPDWQTFSAPLLETVSLSAHPCLSSATCDMLRNGAPRLTVFHLSESGLNLNYAQGQFVLQTMYGQPAQSLPKRKVDVVPAVSPAMPSVRVLRLLGPLSLSYAASQQHNTSGFAFLDCGVRLDLDRLTRLFPSLRALFVSENEPLPDIYSAGAQRQPLCAWPSGENDDFLVRQLPLGLSCPAAFMRSFAVILFAYYGQQQQPGLSLQASVHSVGHSQATGFSSDEEDDVSDGDDDGDDDNDVGDSAAAVCDAAAADGSIYADESDHGDMDSVDDAATDNTYTNTSASEHESEREFAELEQELQQRAAEGDDEASGQLTQLQQQRVRAQINRQYQKQSRVARRQQLQQQRRTDRGPHISAVEHGARLLPHQIDAMIDSKANLQHKATFWHASGQMLSQLMVSRKRLAIGKITSEPSAPSLRVLDMTHAGAVSSPMHSPLMFTLTERLHLNNAPVLTTALSQTLPSLRELHVTGGVPDLFERVARCCPNIVRLVLHLERTVRVPDVVGAELHRLTYLELGYESSGASEQRLTVAAPNLQTLRIRTKRLPVLEVVSASLKSLEVHVTELQDVVIVSTGLEFLSLWTSTRAAQDLVQTLLVQSPQLRTLELALRYLNTLCLTAEQTGSSLGVPHLERLRVLHCASLKELSVDLPTLVSVEIRALLSLRSLSVTASSLQTAFLGYMPRCELLSLCTQALLDLTLLHLSASVLHVDCPSLWRLCAVGASLSSWDSLLSDKRLLCEVMVSQCVMLQRAVMRAVPSLRSVLIVGCPLVSLHIDAPSLLSLSLPFSIDMLHDVHISCRTGAPAMLLTRQLTQRCVAPAKDNDNGLPTPREEPGRLKQLSLTGTLPNLLDLTALPSLRSLRLLSSTVEELVLPACVTDDMMRSILSQSSEVIKRLTVPGCRMLTSLDLHLPLLQTLVITDAMQLRSVRIRGPLLQTVTVEDCPRLSDLQIAACDHLHSLTLQNTSVSSLRTCSLSALPLRQLSVSRSPMTGDELSWAVAQMPQLLWLQADECPLLHSVTLHSDTLRFVSLVASQLEHADIRCPNLYYMDMSKTAVRVVCVLRMVTAAPRLCRLLLSHWNPVRAPLASAIAGGAAASAPDADDEEEETRAAVAAAAAVAVERQMATDDSVFDWCLTNEQAAEVDCLVVGEESTPVGLMKQWLVLAGFLGNMNSLPELKTNDRVIVLSDSAVRDDEVCALCALMPPMELYMDRCHELRALTLTCHAVTQLCVAMCGSLESIELECYQLALLDAATCPGLRRMDVNVRVSACVSACQCPVLSAFTLRSGPSASSRADVSYSALTTEDLVNGLRDYSVLYNFEGCRFVDSSAITSSGLNVVVPRRWK